MNKGINHNFRGLLKRNFVLLTTLIFSIVINSFVFGQTVIHCWDFNGTTPFTSPVNTDNRVTGEGNITFNITDVQNFAGNTSNACDGSVAGAAFCPRGGTGEENNGNSFILTFSTVGYENIGLSFWVRRTGTGFDNNTIEYSNDGGINFSTLAVFNPTENTGGQVLTYDLSGITAANNNPDFQIRITLDGATSSTGNNRYDNIKLLGTIASTNSISINTISSTTFDVDCDNDAIGTVNFTSDGVFDAGNEFIVELSNPNGDFSATTTIGTLSGADAEGTDPSGSIDIAIPSGISEGTEYRVRLISTDPNSVGVPNDENITINSEYCPSLLPASEGLLINEFSNGSSGDKEFYEFIVAGRCGDIVDVRGYIIDDNNGTFTTDYTTPAGSGIAAGHMRLTGHSQWESIPVGSLIVVYNEDDLNDNLPPDDPYDSDNDSLYVIGHKQSDLLEITNEIPNVPDPDSTYAPVSDYNYTLWAPLQLANGRDAIQVRAPDGVYFHGVSYGGAVISGGPNDMKIYNGNMTGMCGWFNTGDFLDASNWSTGDVSFETPGRPNNAANEEWLRTMRDPLTDACPVEPLPITLGYFKGAYDGRRVQLKWETYTETNNHRFELFHSVDGKTFEKIGTVIGAGNSIAHIYYDFFHNNPSSGMNYYKLKSFDYDGTEYQKGIIAVVVDLDDIFYDRITQTIQLNHKSDYSVYNAEGKLVTTVRNEKVIPFSKSGIFFVLDERKGKTTKIATF